MVKYTQTIGQKHKMVKYTQTSTNLRPALLSCLSQLIDLQSKSIGWFLFDRIIGFGWVE